MKEVNLSSLPSATRNTILFLLKKLNPPFSVEAVDHIRFSSSGDGSEYIRELIEVNGLLYGVDSGRTDYQEYTSDFYEWTTESDKSISDRLAEVEDTLYDLIEILEKVSQTTCNTTQIAIFHNTQIHELVDEAIKQRFSFWLRDFPKNKVTDIYFAGKDDCTNIVEIELDYSEAENKKELNDYIELFNEKIPVKVYIYY